MQKGERQEPISGQKALPRAWPDAIKESATPGRPQSLPITPYLAAGTLLVQVFPDAALLRVRQHQGALPQQPLGVLLRRLQSPQAVIAGWRGENTTRRVVRRVFKGCMMHTTSILILLISGTAQQAARSTQGKAWLVYKPHFCISFLQVTLYHLLRPKSTSPAEQFKPRTLKKFKNLAFPTSALRFHTSRALRHPCGLYLVLG